MVLWIKKTVVRGRENAGEIRFVTAKLRENAGFLSETTPCSDYPGGAVLS